MILAHRRARLIDEMSNLINSKSLITLTSKMQEIIFVKVKDNSAK